MKVRYNAILIIENSSYRSDKLGDEGEIREILSDVPDKTETGNLRHANLISHFILV